MLLEATCASPIQLEVNFDLTNYNKRKANLKKINK